MTFGVAYDSIFLLREDDGFLETYNCGFLADMNEDPFYNNVANVSLIFCWLVI